MFCPVSLPALKPVSCRQYVVYLTWTSAHARGVVIKSQVWCVATEIEFVRAGRAGEL